MLVVYQILLFEYCETLDFFGLFKLRIYIKKVNSMLCIELNALFLIRSKFVDNRSSCDLATHA